MAAEEDRRDNAASEACGWDEEAACRRVEEGVSLWADEGEVEGGGEQEHKTVDSWHPYREGKSHAVRQSRSWPSGNVSSACAATRARLPSVKQAT